jgi:hypothetical protein
MIYEGNWNKLQFLSTSNRIQQMLNPIDEPISILTLITIKPNFEIYVKIENIQIG